MANHYENNFDFWPCYGRVPPSRVAVYQLGDLYVGCIYQGLQYEVAMQHPEYNQGQVPPGPG